VTRVRTGLVGAAGEYFVAAELSRRNWLATVTIKNAPGTDVLAQHAETGRVIAIQTKTTLSGDAFMLSQKDEAATTETNQFFVLVRMDDLVGRPRFWIMPRNHVAAYLWVSHRRWLGTPARGGRQRQDSSMRTIVQNDLGTYFEAWESLEHPTTEVEYVLPDWVREWAARPEVGLPAGHPDAGRITGE
jgi:hypothetical protein